MSAPEDCDHDWYHNPVRLAWVCRTCNAERRDDLGPRRRRGARYRRGPTGPAGGQDYDEDNWTDR